MDKRLSSLPSSCRKNLLTASISRGEEKGREERRGVALYYMVSYLIMIACSQKKGRREIETKRRKEQGSSRYQAEPDSISHKAREQDKLGGDGEDQDLFNRRWMSLKRDTLLHAACVQACIRGKGLNRGECPRFYPREGEDADVQHQLVFPRWGLPSTPPPAVRSIVHSPLPSPLSLPSSLLASSGDSWLA